jgi:hypothetical protein
MKTWRAFERMAFEATMTDVFLSGVLLGAGAATGMFLVTIAVLTLGAWVLS